MLDHDEKLAKFHYNCISRPINCNQHIFFQPLSSWCKNNNIAGNDFIKIESGANSKIVIYKSSFDAMDNGIKCNNQLQKTREGKEQKIEVLMMFHPVFSRSAKNKFSLLHEV